MLHDFIQKYTGQLVNFDNHPDSGGQAVQLIAQWATFLGLPYQWANASDWWDDSDETFAEHWIKVIRDSEQPKAGDIVVFSSLLPGSDSAGHLSIFVETVAGYTSEWIGFDANWAGKSAHLQSHNWSYVLGWFTPVNRAVLESFVPTPIALPTGSEPYELAIVTPFIATLGPDKQKLYNLADVSWNSFNDSPIMLVDGGTDIGVNGIAKHRLGGTFYVPNTDRAEGYLLEDFESIDKEVVDADSPEATPGAYHTFNAGYSAPSSTDQLRVKFPIPKYRVMTDALEGQNSTGELNPDNYFVFKRSPNGMANLTLTLGSAGVWINPADLEPKPAPEAKKEIDWRVLIPFPPQTYFKATSDGPIVDVDGAGPNLRIVERQPILIAGYFRGPDRQVYYAPEATHSNPSTQWYGVAKEILKPMNVTPTDDQMITTRPAARRDTILTLLEDSRLLKKFKDKYKKVQL